MFIIQAFNVLTAILMIVVISEQARISQHQAEIMNKQTKLLELEKKPMLFFRKRGLSRTESGDVCRFEILNISKYPVLIKAISFEPQVKQEAPNIERKIILPDMMVTPEVNLPRIVKLKVSNLYYPDVVLEYQYDPDSEEIKIKEEF
jgi:hypothetical protein